MTLILIPISGLDFLKGSASKKRKAEDGSSSSSDSSDDDDDDSSSSSSSSDSSDSSQEKDTSDESSGGDRDKEKGIEKGKDDGHKKGKVEAHSAVAGGKESSSLGEKKIPAGKGASSSNTVTFSSGSAGRATAASPSKGKSSSTPAKSIKAILMGINGQKKPGRGRPPKILSQLVAGKTKKKLSKPKVQLLPGQILIKRPRGRPPKYPRPVQLQGQQQVTGHVRKKAGRPRKYPRPLAPVTTTTTAPTSNNPYSTITQALNSRPQSGQTSLQKSLGLIPSTSVPRTLPHQVSSSILKQPSTSTVSTSVAKLTTAASSTGNSAIASSDSSSSVPSNFSGDVNKNVIAAKSKSNDVGKDANKATGTPTAGGSLPAESRSLPAKEPVMEVRAFWKPPPETKPLLDQVVHYGCHRRISDYHYKGKYLRCWIF